jgi:hypothetical protein
MHDNFESVEYMESSNLKVPLALQVVKAVLYSFIGIRRRIDMQADLDRLPLLPVIVGGLIAAAVFVGTLLFTVRMVVAS